ncbi:MAG: 6,7-dimethyl-8-ribityllumazine synthase [Acidimicrobiaceae bacterium]|nr:6,7-dimethyl-8-ribityllumazine synthase [Acidimicrobiaceae bacterium]MBS1264622.1 6,7-dimethyl-8-ribityllumazine synthase [Acidimicrobiaceae bacterium]MDP6696425.1 6,7-dimethyl-8-ribityllumazine synthase [Acidimicrobiales bacterium]
MREHSVEVDGSGLRIGIVASRFNEPVVARLLEGATTRLVELGVDDADLSLAWVAGAFELPLASRAMAESGSVDAIVCLGCVIRGETAHFDYVCAEAASGISRVGHDTGVPVSFGVLTTDTFEQAAARAGGTKGNKGADVAEAAVEMARLLRELVR